MDELKPCPFCGGNVKMIRGFVKGTNTIVCLNPDCGADVMFFGAEKDKAKFIKRWNTRKGRRTDA